jgi:dimethylargininase
MKLYGCQSMVGKLEKVLVKKPGSELVLNDYRKFGFLGKVDLARAEKEHEAFVDILLEGGCEVHFLDGSKKLMDSIYTHDPAIVTNRGAFILRMGKELRRGEERQMESAFKDMGVPIFSKIHPHGTAEGGDCLWLDEKTLAVGRGYRTNEGGFNQLKKALEGIRIIEVPLPHFTGAGSVLHLMSLISLLDKNMAVIYPRLMPIPFLELLKKRKMNLIPIPEEEFDTMGCNVLALATRRCLMLNLNRKTRKLLEKEGCDVMTYRGNEISIKGSGGPTCLTRPILRR